MSFHVKFDSTAYDSQINGIGVRQVLPCIDIARCHKFNAIQFGWWRWGIKCIWVKP